MEEITDIYKQGDTIKVSKGGIQREIIVDKCVFRKIPGRIEMGVYSQGEFYLLQSAILERK